MLSICRLVPMGHGRGEFQELERFRAIDFPPNGPSHATELQKYILDQALQLVALEDHGSTSDSQIVLLSTTGRIVAVEGLGQRGHHNGMQWVGGSQSHRPGLLEPQTSEPARELPAFMCERQPFSHGPMAPNCFEVIDSQGRAWHCYQVVAGLLDWSVLPQLGRLQRCQSRDLPDQLGHVPDRFGLE